MISIRILFIGTHFHILFSGLPFQYAQSMVFPVQNTSSGSNPYFCNITSLLNADLTTIIFHVLEAGDEYPATLNNWAATAGGNRGACIYGQQLANIELRLNGQLLFRYDEDAYEYVKLAEVISPFQCEAVGTFCRTAAKIEIRKAKLYYYELNLARLRALVTESHLQNTPRYSFINVVISVFYIFYFILKKMYYAYRFTNQTFQLTFQVPRTYANWLSNSSDNNKKYSVIVSYCYNAVFLCGGDGGQSQLITA